MIPWFPSATDAPPPDPSATGPLASSPVVVWVGIVVGVLIVLASAFPKILGPISQGWSDWLEAARARAAARDDADIADRDRENAYLQGVVDTLRAEIIERDRLIGEHLPWDYAALEGRNPPFNKPIPPLYPTRSASVADVVRRAEQGGTPWDTPPPK